MATTYDSDSSIGEDIETGVTLGFASKEPTEDDFSHLGGTPSWREQSVPPPGSLAKCQTCNGLLSLILQLHADLPNDFPGHERALYIFACRRKACRRKTGSVRGLRYSSIDERQARPVVTKTKTTTDSAAQRNISQPAQANLGNTLFGKSSTFTPSANPFGPSTGTSAVVNSFGQQPEAAKDTTPVETLPQTFAQKASISAPDTKTSLEIAKPAEPWPEASTFPDPFPTYHLDADNEFLEPEATSSSRAVQAAQLESEADGNGAMDVKDAFESSMDKAFQRFADRMSQNPDQVLRYDFKGQPLLYSKTDAVGKSWPKVPRCSRCGSTRIFELQLTPHLITDLEADDISLDGMDWGTIILAVCSQDCAGWNEEWIGVQWEELASKKPM